MNNRNFAVVDVLTGETVDACENELRYVSRTTYRQSRYIDIETGAVCEMNRFDIEVLMRQHAVIKEVAANFLNTLNESQKKVALEVIFAAYDALDFLQSNKKTMQEKQAEKDCKSKAAEDFFGDQQKDELAIHLINHAFVRPFFEEIQAPPQISLAKCGISLFKFERNSCIEQTYNWLDNLAQGVTEYRYNRIL